MQNAVKLEAEAADENQDTSEENNAIQKLKRSGESYEETETAHKKQKTGVDKEVVCGSFKTEDDENVVSVRNKTEDDKNVLSVSIKTEEDKDVACASVKTEQNKGSCVTCVDGVTEVVNKESTSSVDHEDSVKILPVSIIKDTSERSSIVKMEIESTNVPNSDVALNQSGVENAAIELKQQVQVNGAADETVTELDENDKTTTKEDSVIKVPKRWHQVEADVGITEYIGNHNGFSGILKHRYSDFIVNEITEEKNVVELTSFDLPPEGPKVEKDLLKNLIPDDKILEIENLAKSVNTEIITIKADDMDKDTRTKIHECIKENYQTLTSTTDLVNEEKFITIRQLGEKRKEKRQWWPRYRPNFTHFVMYKENTDTLQAINTISSMLWIKPGDFNYAGTKDKRGKTSQMVSVRRVEGKRLMQLNKGLKMISLGNVCYKDCQLKLGDLAGNRFTIVLREIDANDVDLITALTSFQDKGFINYYGMQRFGTTEISTHSVGRALILQKWQEAIDLILKPRVGDGEYLNACRRIWSETKDAKRALNALSRKDTIEGQLLQGLVKHRPNDLVNALNNVPRNMRLMYLHSYQSYIWNLVVSKRIAQFGLEPKVGDLYQKLDEPTYTVCAKKKNKIKVVEDTTPRIVTQEDIDNKKVTIYDIVLPLPGNSIIYPTNEAADWYKEILAKDNMDLESFVSRVRMYSLSGSYRHLIVLPKNFSYSVLTYGDKNEDLCLTDWDKLMGNELTIQKSDKYKALKLIFDLDSSTYATMAIREITKRDTSIWAQKNV